MFYLILSNNEENCELKVDFKDFYYLIYDLFIF